MIRAGVRKRAARTALGRHATVLLTPHCAWASEAAQARLARRLVAQVVEHVLATEPPTP